MTFRRSLILVLAAVVTACGDPTAPTPAEPSSEVFLKDVELSHLPSPYYHFDYDIQGRVSAVAFASGLRNYAVTYEGDRVAEMREVTYFNGAVIGTADRLEYGYDQEGRVGTVSYVRSDGLVYTTLDYVYEEERLKGIVRSELIDGDLIGDRTMAFSYYPDGNLETITEHRLPLADQAESLTVDRFERYDQGINVDGFGLLHVDFFDHVVLLPGIQLQQGNPGRQIRTGDGTNFQVDYVYTYDESGRPVAKSGVVTIQNGADAGRAIPISSVFSYY